MKIIKIMFFTLLLFTATAFAGNGNEKTKTGTTTERIVTTGIVISELGLLMAILFYWKRTRSENKIQNNNVFKKNIKALRNERIKYFHNEKLSEKRRMLQTKIANRKINGKYITAKAKRMAVAKGEIFLAARIKQLEMKT